jgi:hypothetical protein
MNMVHHKLRPFIDDPGKITKKAIDKVADDLNKLCSAIVDGFLTYNFLSDKEGDVKRNVLENYATLEQLENASYDIERFIGHIQNEIFHDAFEIFYLRVCFMEIGDMEEPLIKIIIGVHFSTF